MPPTPNNEALAAERKRFEHWYTTHAFDYSRDPIGSRDCSLQWVAWQAALASSGQAAQRNKVLSAAADRLLQEVRIQRGYAHSEQDQFLSDIEACANAVKSSGQAASAVPVGHLLLNKHGLIEDFHPRVREFFGAVISDDAYQFDEEWLVKQDRDYPHLAPHSTAFAYASPTQPASAPAREGVGEGLSKSKLFSLLQTCTSTPPVRLPDGYVAFARAVEAAHGISAPKEDKE